jgi:NADH:ubiquinone oxidoreductase subunit 4 (subunit M)
MFGPLKYPGATHDDSHAHHEHETQSGDIGAREIGLLVPIALAVVLLGIMPNAVLTTIEPSLKLIQEPLPQPRRAELPAKTPLEIAYDMD